jgi:hypothetical protein
MAEWEQMTEVEKIEDLRRDVKRLFNIFNQSDDIRGDFGKIRSSLDLLGQQLAALGKPDRT